MKLPTRSSLRFRCVLHRHNDMDGELVNAACPSIAAEDLLSLLEYSATQLGGRASANLKSRYKFHTTTILLLGDNK